VKTLDQELEAAWRAFRPDAAAGSHPYRWDASENPEREPDNAVIDQILAATGSQVHMVPATFDKRHGSPPVEGAKIDLGEWEERAAILEYEGGLNRAEAEKLAADMVGRT